MTDVFIYADETGDLDMTGARGTSTYFGFGTAVLPDGHGHQLWQGQKLRCALEAKGVRLPAGMHAKNDSHTTRDEVFDLIRQQAPRFDMTFLYKANVEARVKQGGPVQLYKQAWYLHFQRAVSQVSNPGDTVYVIVGSLQTHNKRQAIRHALEEVCAQNAHGRVIVPCIWDAASAWGIQIADYGLWATQRILEDRPCKWFASCVEPTLESEAAPWGRAA